MNEWMDDCINTLRMTNDDDIYCHTVSHEMIVSSNFFLTSSCTSSDAPVDLHLRDFQTKNTYVP